MLGLWFLLKDLVRSDEPQFSVLQPATGRETSSSGVASDGKSGGARRETGFERLLSAVLLLAVGVELAILLIRHTPESLIELMFFVIARRILLKTDEFYELLMGVAALAGVFAVRKYLLRGQPHRPAVE
jgi:hypothetical protein